MIKRILLGSLVLIIIVIAYHFYAASSAERALDESLQSVAAETDLVITYSSLDLNPFTGDILFSDLSVIGDRHIQRATEARIDLSYSDFLFFMIWGTEAGLRQIGEGLVELRNVSHTDRLTLEELKADRANVVYRGNLWDLIVLGITRRAAESLHRVEVSGEMWTLSSPGRGIGRIGVDTLRWQSHLGPAPAGTDSLANSLTLTGISWAPHENIRETYGFFIRGFGYPEDAVPVGTITIRYDRSPDPFRMVIHEAALVSELFTLSVSGELALPSDSTESLRADTLSLRIFEMSAGFENFTGQLQNLFGMQIPRDGDGIRFGLAGPLSEPRFLAE